MFNELGENVYIKPPLNANRGGHFYKIGNNVYINYNLTMVDDTRITIGSHTMIGPNVTLIAGTHPLETQLRKEGYQYNLPVSIGENSWLGANVTVLQGVTIGNNVVVGANGLVTKDIPDNTLVMGSPAKIVTNLD